MSRRKKGLILFQLGKFCTVGILGALLNYIVFYYLLTILEINYIFSGVIGFLVPIPFVFIVNRKWTFDSRVSYKKGLFVYTCVSLVALISHSVTQLYVREILSVSYEYSQLYGIFVSAGVNFLCLKFIVFRIN